MKKEMVFVRNMKKEDREQFFKNLIIQDFGCKRMYLSAVNFQTKLFQYEKCKKYFKC